MSSDESGGLLGVGQAEYDELPLSEALSWFKQRLEKFVVGGIYLLAGQPGIGKSALGIQIASTWGSVARKPFTSLRSNPKKTWRSERAGSHQIGQRLRPSERWRASSPRITFTTSRRSLASWPTRS